MKKIERPKEKVREVYSKCISKVHDKALKNSLELCIQELEDDEQLYIEKGTMNKLCEFPKKRLVNSTVSINEMKKIYTYRMVGLNQPGRIYYNKICNAVQICPFCGIRDADTLDHYLPKSQYATTTVTPVNLVPACKQCNGNKNKAEVINVNEEVWHPYFDNYCNVRWLHSEIKKTYPVTAVFAVDTSFIKISQDEERKIRNSFRIFRLKNLYEISAAKELRDIQEYMKDLRKRVGKEGVMEHLEGMYDSLKIEDINYWKAVLYCSLKDCDWYINKYLLSI